MNREPVELRVGGRTYRVASSATDDDLMRLARVVDDKLRELGPSVAFHPQSMLLVAISLAHEIEEERERHRATAERAKAQLERLLERVDAALEAPEGDAQPAPQPQPPAIT